MTTTLIALTIFFMIVVSYLILSIRSLKREIQSCKTTLELRAQEYLSASWQISRIKKDIEGLYLSRCTHASRLEVLEDAIIRCNTDVIHGVLTVIIRTPKSQPNKESV